jgi:VanZ family protein
VNIIHKWLFWAYLSTLLVLSLMPTGQLPNLVFSIWDKAQHALGFALLAVLAMRAYPGWALLNMATALLVFGGLVELAQAATGWRLGEWADLLADGLGIGVGLLAWRWTHRRTIRG